MGAGLDAQGSFWASARKPTGSFDASGKPVLGAGRIDQAAVITARLAASWRINDHYSASLNVNNLFDKRYYNRAGFYNS